MCVVFLIFYLARIPTFYLTYTLPLNFTSILTSLLAFYLVLAYQAKFP